MSDLIERLEKATGPDREIDGAIALSLGWTFEKRKGDRHPYWRLPDVTDWYMREHKGPLEYTASTDAALTLVPDNHGWSVDSEEVDGAGDVIRPSAVVWHFGKYPNITDRAFAATPAIALCIAALKARAIISGKDPT